jgi:hypothetical protein
MPVKVVVLFAPPTLGVPPFDVSTVITVIPEKVSFYVERMRFQLGRG